MSKPLTEKQREYLTGLTRKSQDLGVRRWAQKLLDESLCTTGPELPERPPGEAPASAAVPIQPEAIRQGTIGNCHDCNAPIDKRGKNWQPFHAGADMDTIIHTCLACANIRWRAINSK